MDAAGRIGRAGPDPDAQEERRGAATQPMMRPFKRGGRARRSGLSLIEVMVSIVLLGILLSISIPSYRRSIEQSRADVAAANLRAVWSAQRLYWLDRLDQAGTGTYAVDALTLVNGNYLDPTFPHAATEPYTYSFAGVADTTFTATATRTGSASCTGTIVIDQDGEITVDLVLSETLGDYVIRKGFLYEQ